MSKLLSLTRAARLVGVPRVDLQRKIQTGELTSYDGMVNVDTLLASFPDAQLEDTVELKRIELIRDHSFGKRVLEHVLPDAEVLAARLTELSKSLENNQSQLKQLNIILDKLWLKLDVTEGSVEVQKTLSGLKLWLQQALTTGLESGFSNLLAIKDNMLRVMAAQVTLLPSKQDYLLEGQDTLLEAAMRAGIALSYGCSGGNCGLCKAKVVSGQVKKTRNHDYVISDLQKSQGYVLLCSNTAVTDVTLEAAVANSVQDIPYQQLTAIVKAVEPLGSDMLLLHLQTPRSQRLRFLAGQAITLRVGNAYTAELSIASCPCDDRNVLLHVRRQPGNLFSDFVFSRLKLHDSVELEGPQGEFILHEKSPRALHFIAFDDGFAPIKSLIEHAMSLNQESISLHWIGSSHENIYLPNVVRAWRDALDSFHYYEHVLGIDLRNVTVRKADKFRALLDEIVDKYAWLIQSDVYLAGPASSVNIAEQYFIELGLPKTRISVKSI